jgi:hypothetical protein
MYKVGAQALWLKFDPTPSLECTKLDYSASHDTKADHFFSYLGNIILGYVIVCCGRPVNTNVSEHLRYQVCDGIMTHR